MQKNKKGYDPQMFGRLLMGVLMLGTVSCTQKKVADTGYSIPLAQDYTVAVKAPGNNHEEGYIYFNGFAKLPGGAFIALAVIDQPNSAKEKGVIGHQGKLIFSRSDDGGETWKVLDSNLDFGQRMIGSALFVHKSMLYLFVSPMGDDGIIRVASSDDEGLTWSEWIEVIKIPRQARVAAKASDIRETTYDDPNWTEDQRWLAFLQQSMVVKDNRLFFAPSERTQDMAVVMCDLEKGITDPDSWKISKTVPVTVPRELNPGYFPGPSMGTLEGNVVEVDGRLRLLARQVVDRYGTSNIAAVFDIEVENDEPRLSFVQFFPIPGAHGLFTIVYDERSKMYWMASNLESNSQKWVKSPSGSHKGRDRRFLTLWYSIDALNWFPAGIIAAAKDMQQTFNYPSMEIDGDDLVLVSRTTIDPVNYTSHDADHVTFHRVRNFRSLAMNIFPIP